MKNNASIERFNQVMQKYRFVDPLPSDVQRHLRTSKRRQFKKTLKRTAGYSTIFVLISNIFFTLKRFGISITIVKSVILLGIMTLLTAGIASTLLYWFVLQKAPDPDVIQNARDRAAADVGGDSSAKDKEEYPPEPAAVIEDRLGVQAFAGVNVPGAQAAGVTDRVAKNLSALRGGARVVNLRFGRGGRRSGMMLLGNVESVDGSYSITARVVSVKDSRILFYDSETASSRQDIDGACDRLAQKIYNKIK